MNSEGVSSLAVVDNQFNVVGNISNADVKVVAPDFNWQNSASIPLPYLRKKKGRFSRWKCDRADFGVAAHQIKFRAFTRKHLHPLHLRDPLHPWDE